jgi:membrane-bound acyltransferase YfiQ involved in biofilm formation
MNTEPKTDFLGLTRGLSGTQIKILGAVMMVFDHLYQMFYTRGVPQWFTWIGRPVAPIFLFMCAEGFSHTRSKKRYVLQLLIGFEAMNIMSMVLSSALPNEDVTLMFSIFGSLIFDAL